MIKQFFLGTSSRPFRVKSGLAKGLKIHFDPNTEASKILGFYEYEIQKQFKKYAKQADTILDIGSYDGYYSLIFRNYNAAGKIFACEAGSNVISRIEKNYNRNFQESDNFQIINKFIGQQTKENYISVDELIKEEKANTPFLKIDVEGAEMDVLKGAVNTLKNKDCKLIIETHSKELEEKCFTFLGEQGYKVTLIDNHPLSKIFRKGRLLTHNRWLNAEK